MCCGFGATQTDLGSGGISEPPTVAVGTLFSDGVLRFRCSPGVSLCDLGSSGISASQRGPTVAVVPLIIAANSKSEFAFNAA